VVGIPGTVSWNRSTAEFIQDCREDGTVEVIMHWMNDGYGMQVRTTARGLLQTRLVADVLREKFDRRS